MQTDIQKAWTYQPKTDFRINMPFNSFALPLDIGLK